MIFQFLVVCLILAAALAAKSDASNDWPIIGVFTQPTTSTEGNCNGNCLYLAASYVKYLESAGARVVPINYYATNSELDKIVDSVNGIFFPGGGAVFPKQAQYVFDRVVAHNDAGDFMPMWGTCMGFQWLLMCASRDTNILDPKTGQMDSYNISMTLNFTSEAKTSRLFSAAGDEIYTILETEPVTMNNHHYGIYPSHFAATPSLTSFFNVLSTNYDKKGVEFVSTIEAFKYPIYGSQWHPEKNNFEWGKTNGIPNEAINHTPDAIKVAQFTANYFVNEARRNLHSYASADDEDKALIENYTPSKTTGSFMETYFFHF